MQKWMGSSTGTELLSQNIICVTREESCILMPWKITLASEENPNETDVLRTTNKPSSRATHNTFSTYFSSINKKVVFKIVVTIHFAF